MKKILAFLIIFSTLFLTSCFDSKEVDNMVYVVAIGTDKEDDGQYSYTFQYALPLNISKGSSGDGEPLQCETVTDTNIYSAIDSMSRIISKEIILSHLKLIAFSQDIAFDGLEKFKPEILSDIEILPSACVVITQGTAEDYLKNVSSPLELNPAKYYNFAFDEKNSPFIEAFYLKNFFEKSDYVIPLVYAEDKKADTDGGIVFKDHKQISYLTADEIPYFKLLSGTLNSFTIDLTGQGFSAVVTQQKKPFIKVDKDNLNVYITLYLTKQIHGTPSKDADNMINNKIRTKCLNIIKKAQSKNADILNIKTAFRPHFLTLDQFETFNFYEKYPEIYFDVKIK